MKKRESPEPKNNNLVIKPLGINYLFLAITLYPLTPEGSSRAVKMQIFT